MGRYNTRDVYKRQAYLKAKERYDTQREKLAGRYKAKTAMYEALMFLLIWYSVSVSYTHLDVYKRQGNKGKFYLVIACHFIK